MTVNKLERFAEVSEFSHVLEHTDFHSDEHAKPKGEWKPDMFGNENPITLELACGTGAYTLELARRNPERNYIGVDIKGSRLWKGAKQAKEDDLDNVCFLRIFIDHLDEYFAANEVDEIWITFADPYPRAGDRNNRLTHPKFLQQYRQILSPGGFIHFKTDDSNFYNYTLRSVKKFGGCIAETVDNIYKSRAEDELLTIKTVFEKKHLQNEKIISYCKFNFG